MLDAFLHYDFLRTALVAGLLSSVLCGVIGTFVVVKRLVFIAGGLAHAAFAGLGLGLYLGFDPRIGAALVAVGGAVAVELLGRSRVHGHDAAIGIVWSVGMAIGIVFLYLTPGYAPSLMTYLFGNILTVRPVDLLILGAVTVLVLGFVLLFYKELVAIAFDEDFARVQGAPVRALMTVLMALVGLSIVQLIQIGGIVLVMALLTVPPLIGLALTRSFFGVLLVATATGAALTLAGLGVSYRFDLPSGPSIVLLGALALGAVAAGGRLRRRRGTLTR